ncbi:MAG: nitrilase family protein [Bacteroidales bacterium]|nr:nitrilase family protein [Bacteroidales bacterium]MBN2819465.1 nitrilase family protein [Bacteroidales bacterium]
MTDSIRIGVFQANIIWESIEQNQVKLEKVLTSKRKTAELVVLPEMYTTGFSMEPDKFSKDELDRQLLWQQQMSDLTGVSLAGSLITQNNNLYFNRFVFTRPSKEIMTYDKRHLFRMGKEDKLFSPGIDRKIFSYEDILLMPQICYDLRFPVWSRNNFAYHILIYVANWPSSRQTVWDTLLRARAIENQCYTIGVNRVGINTEGVNYVGGSAVYGPQGEEIFKLGDKEEYFECNLSVSELVDFRKKFPMHLDADEFKIKNRD